MHELMLSVVTETLHCEWPWCERGEVKLVEALLENSNHDIHIPNCEGLTPLMSASMHHHTSIVTIVLASGVDINQQHPTGATALTVACGYNFPAIVRLLVKNGARVDLLNRESWSPLMIAAQLGHSDVEEILLKEGKAKIDQQHPNGTTALHIVSQHNFLEVVKLLLNYGACVDLPDRRGWTPLMSATQHVRLVW
ncbi:hypothetical protein V7S43_010541 [Phytophthora oleae]|uniref:Uncharacterized protein n=1 Tax=Phytophthora oleae TaxID=2107226 RepID=A0ABD3FCR8_9STRA